jgi:hypothetical protein
MGTAESAARSTARGGRPAARPGRMRTRPAAGRGTARRGTPATAGGIGRMVSNVLRRR